MTDRELLYIKTVAEERNITHAARRLHVAQPSLTQSLHKIESAMGMPLFLRQRDGLVLTEAGQLCYEAACDILGRWEQLGRDVERLRQPDSGRIRVGASWYSTLLILTAVLPEFRRQYPHVEIDLVEKRSRELEEQMSLGQLDLILTHSFPEEMRREPVSHSKRCHTACILPERFWAAVPEAMVPALIPPGQEALDPAALEGQPFVRFREDQRIRQISDHVLAEADVRPMGTVSAYGFRNVLELVRQGLGVSFLPERYLRQKAEDLSGIRIFPIASPAASWQTCLTWREFDFPSAPRETLISLLQTCGTFL